MGGYILVLIRGMVNDERSRGGDRLRKG